MEKNPKVVLDTNVLVSAIVYKGIPRNILVLALEKKIQVVISRILVSELLEVLTKKFHPHLSQKDISRIHQQVQKKFELVHPHKIITVVRDEDDNKVLEAAIEGECDYIITGDKDLLDLKEYKGILILRPADFLKQLITHNT